MLYTLNNALWGPATLALLLGSGIYLTKIGRASCRERV